MRLCDGERREKVMEVVCKIGRQIEASEVPCLEQLFCVQ